MHIIELRAENIKRLKAVQITPDGPVQIVAGRNAQGKTSVLDAIWLALKYTAANKAVDRVVRDGEDEAMTRLDLGDMVVTRTWNGDKSDISVVGKDGVPLKRPQEVLDGLVGKLSFDPLAFANADSKTQVDTLLGLLDLDVDVPALDAERAKLYDKRHLIGQDRTKVKGAFESMTAFTAAGVPYDELPTDPVPISDLLTEYQAAQDTITRHNDARHDLDTANYQVTEAVAAVAKAEKALADAKEHLEAVKVENETARAVVDRLGHAPDLTPIKTALGEAEGVNQAIKDAADWRRARDAYEAKDAEWKTVDAQMAEIDAAKAAALAKAAFPIDGLGFSDEGVTFLGQSLKDASGAERLRVSLAIGMAANPTLRVIRITDGSLLDSDNLAAIEAMAKQHDFQVWIERVDETGCAGVVIEDGRVA